MGRHKITLIENATMKRFYPYRVPMKLREEVDRQIQQLIGWVLIYPTESSFAHPVVCVAKKDGKVRLCIDYRQLNSVTETDVFPM